MTDPAPATFLERIVEATREDLAVRKNQMPLEKLRERLASAPAPRDFAAALRPRLGGPARLIGEVKHSSPSKGVLTGYYEPVGRAWSYETGGAAAISVLTEPHFFRGSLADLTAVRASVALPVLRKDFLFDLYQVYEARAAGADAVLLILAILDDSLAARLLDLTRSLGMEALVEAHTETEVKRAVALGARVIGVNSRNLRTFKVDSAAVRQLRALVPPDRVYVSESGVKDASDMTRARVWGSDAVLVGEALMKSTDPEDLARNLANAPGGATARLFASAGQPFVKICGLAEPEQARVAAEAGADAIGLVFAPMAPAHRLLTAERAAKIIAALPPQGERRPIPVGVFVNTPPEFIAALAQRIGLEAIQLNGDESAVRYRQVAQITGLPVIAAVRPTPRFSVRHLLNHVQSNATILLDSAPPGSYGGSGQTGDWDQAREAADAWPLILAGGLTPYNVAEAIWTVRPRGVDVSSGVESTGRGGPAKDLNKIQAFIAAARGAALEF